MQAIALIAHDGKKDEMVAFVQQHQALLTSCHLIATGTTGARISAATGLAVQRMLSGPYGGDAQIAAWVVDGNVALLIFLVDPLNAHPHEPDIQSLQRVCNVHNIPFATNLAAANLLLPAVIAQRG